MDKWWHKAWHKAIGEMSRLRQSLLGFTGGGAGGSYKLDSSRVDYELSRSLYYNTNDSYKLGAGFAKPVVNTSVGFMGVPKFISQDKEAQEVLDGFFIANSTKAQKTHRDSLRDGDCFVWLTREDNLNRSLYPEMLTRLVYNIIPPEQVTKIIRDPITGEIIEYVLKSQHEWEDERGEKKKATIVQRIGIGMRLIEVEEGDNPPGIELGEHPTPWDFIPIVHFKNDADESELFGRSEIEAIEPYLKAYHDVMLHAMKGSKMHSTPRLKLKLKDVKAFLANNFGITEPVKFAKEGGKIDLDGHELLIFGSEDDAEFIEVKSATGDAQVLLKLLFFCIVDTSETPEFVFGVHTPSSQASVREQMPILIRKIENKRESFTESWQHLARIVLAMTAQSENISFSTFATTLQWDKIDPRDANEIAEELKLTVEALIIAVNNHLISQEAAVKYLSKLVETMNDYETDDPDIESERDRIMKTKLDRLRMGDSEYLEKELKDINSILSRKVV